MLYSRFYIVSFIFFSILIFTNMLWIFIFLMTLITAVLLGISGTVTAHIMLSMKHKVRLACITSSFSNFHKYLNERYIMQVHKIPDRLPVLFGRSVDFALQDLLDLVINDLISPWLKDLSFSYSNVQLLIKKEVWLAVCKLHERLTKIDETKLIAVDIVSKLTCHFEKIRSIQTYAMVESQGIFYLSNHLMTPEKELNYLRKISELMITVLFSKSLTSHIVNKNLLVELSACKALLPLTVLVTDPNYINNKILEFMAQYIQNHNIHQQGCALAESYQEFLQSIQNSDDVDHLKHIRYSIMTEIMQATTIQNLRKSNDFDKEQYQSSTKNLKRYLGQLTYAKARCDARLKALGYLSFQEDYGNTCGALDKKDIPLEKVLESVYGRKMLSKFLESCNQEYLLIYWAAAEELRGTDKANLHQIAAEIFYTFIHSPTAPIKVEKSIRRRMESFLLGNSGPDAFYEVQDTILDILKSKVYPAFVSTEYFLSFVQNAEVSSQEPVDNNQFYTEGETNNIIIGQAGYARNKLIQLQEKLNNKSQALQALKISLKPESKVLYGLQKEVESLEGEKRQLEAHLNRTEAWSEHLGRWRAVVQSVEVSDEKEPLQFVLVVHVLEDETDSEAISTGWVVLRKLSEFQELHKKLLQVWSGVKQLELPTQSPKFLFGKTSDKSYIEKAKQQIQKYLEFVLMDDRLNASEAIYTFLSPSSEFLKVSANSSGPSPKKTRFSFSTLFKSSNPQGNSESSRDSDDDELSLLDEDIRLNSIEGKDAIAEPLYALLGEIFDLRGVFRWLRKTLIAFVQITYGRTINRQVVESVTWLFSEQMLHYYIQLLTQSWWPNGVLISQLPVLSEEDKLKIRLEAKSQFINNIPEVLSNLVGQQNAKRGALKVFEVVQEVRLNKQLYYDLLELLVNEIFPEIKKSLESTPAKKSAN